MLIVPDLIEPKVPGLLTRDDLHDYLHVGKNAIPAILHRFELRPVEGLFPWRSIWRKLLRIEPEDKDQETMLREQLRPLPWVAAQFGRAESTVRARVAAGTFEHPCAVDLGDPKVDSRSRRWIPAQIRAARNGDPVPRFRPVVSDPSLPVNAPKQELTYPHNPLAGVMKSNDGFSLQRPE